MLYSVVSAIKGMQTSFQAVVLPLTSSQGQGKAALKFPWNKGKVPVRFAG